MIERLRRALDAWLGGGPRRAQGGGPPARACDRLERELAKLAVGMVREVEEEATRAAAREPQNAEAWYLAGRAAAARGDHQRARIALERAAELAPERADFQRALGLTLRALRQRRAALVAFERALELVPDDAFALYHAGRLHAELGETEEARDRLSLALAFDPLASAARVELADLLARCEGREAAIRLLQEPLADGTADVAIYCRLAALLEEAGEVRDAANLCAAAIERFPEEPAPRVNLGMLRLAHEGDAREAERLFRQALELDPSLTEAQANLGLALQEQGRFEEALEHYERLLARDPAQVEYRWNRGIAQLALGHFEAGWSDYELRKLRPDAGGVHELFRLPEWDGTPLAGRAILVYGEQGLGDEIMFASCLPEVIAQARACVIECDARLASLYRRSFPRADIVARGSSRARDWLAEYPQLELQSAVGSLPRFLRRHARDFPQHAGYLSADPELVARWRARLAALGAGRKIGVSWRGGTPRTRGLLRSAPLAALEPLLAVAGATFVVLQRGLTVEERAALAERSNVFVPGAGLDLDNAAALVAALDLVVSVPSTNVHLAGALGRPVWVLLATSPEWRYLWQGSRMPWYPSARLLRQSAPGDWPGLVREARAQLAGWLQEPE